MSRRLIATGVVFVLTLGLAGPVAATVRTLPTAPACKGANLKTGVHNAALRREQTLTQLVANLQQRADTYQLNAVQISALQSANSALAALDAKIASTCYSTFADFQADAAKIWDDYRVYWLRVPQTHEIGAADRLGRVASRLSDLATKLEKYAAGNDDLAKMNADLGKALAVIGTPPRPAPVLTTVAGLEPAKDMTANDAALNAAYTALTNTRTALLAARADAAKVIADLQG